MKIFRPILDKAKDVQESVEKQGFAIIAKQNIHLPEILKTIGIKEIVKTITVEDFLEEAIEQNGVDQIENYFLNNAGEKIVDKDAVTVDVSGHHLWGEQIADALQALIQKHGELKTINLLEELCK